MATLTMIPSGPTTCIFLRSVFLNKSSVAEYKGKRLNTYK